MCQNWAYATKTKNKSNQLIFIAFFELTTPCTFMGKVAKKSTMVTILNTYCAENAYKIFILDSYIK